MCTMYIICILIYIICIAGDWNSQHICAKIMRLDAILMYRILYFKRYVASQPKVLPYIYSRTIKGNYLTS